MKRSILSSILLIFLSSTYAKATEKWTPQLFPVLQNETQCSSVLNHAFVQSTFLVPLQKNSLLNLLRYYLVIGREIATTDTAYNKKNYYDTRSENREPLREHCGAMTWFLQKRFGGEVVLKQFVETQPEGTPREIWHLYLAKVPYVNKDGVIETLDVDLTKTQFDGMKEDFTPPGDELVYDGVHYSHKPGEHFADMNYHWDLDLKNPPRKELELFSIRMETRGGVRQVEF